MQDSEVKVDAVNVDVGASVDAGGLSAEMDVEDVNHEEKASVLENPEAKIGDVLDPEAFSVSDGAGEFTGFNSIDA